MMLSDEILHSTVRIEILSKEGAGYGTGFFYDITVDDKYLPIIITNKHVIEGAIKGSFSLTSIGDDGKPNYKKIKKTAVQDFENYWIKHPDEDVDLCALPLAKVFSQQIAESFYRVPIEKDLVATKEQINKLGAIENITMVGYPNSLWDSQNNLPIVRKGITATDPKIHYNGKKEFIIDAACFPGSSGSPVFILNEGSFNIQGKLVSGNRLMLLGVLYAGPQFTTEGKVQIKKIPMNDQLYTAINIPMNLGMVINAERILELEKEVIRIQRQFSNEK